MKKLIALMTAAIIALSAVSCSKTGPGYTTDTTNTTETTETVPEGMPAPVDPQDAVIDEDTEHLQNHDNLRYACRQSRP